MKHETPSVDSAKPVSVDIIAQQRAAGMSTSLLAMQIDPRKIAAGTVQPQRYLDGMVLAENTMNLVSLDGASGKSTSSRASGISAAATGLWTMLGTRQHDKPLRVAMLHGEETGEQICQSIVSINGAPEQYLEAIGTGRLLIVSMIDYISKANNPESVFDREGRLTATGTEIFRDLADFRPDVLILDTLGSLSDSEYLDSLSPRNTLNILNSFCTKARCTGIAYLHLTKDAGGKITSESGPGELLSLSRGSAMLKNVARSFVVATRAPTGMYPGIQIGANDEIWMATTKCNLQDAKYNNKIFPIIRDSTAMILTAYGAGKALAEETEASSRAAMRELMEYLPHLIRAASDMNKPFPISTRNRMALQSLLTGPMSSLIDATLSPGLITSALEALVREGKIVVCSNTRAGAGQVYCYPRGMYANQAEYQKITGDNLKIREGDYPVEELSTAMQGLHARQADEPAGEAEWMIKAKAEAAARRAAAGTEAQDKAVDVEIRETLRAARARRDHAKSTLKTASEQLAKAEPKHRLAAAELRAAQHAAQKAPGDEAQAKIEFRAAELAAAHVDLNAGQAAVEKAKADLARAEQDIVDGTAQAARLATERAAAQAGGDAQAQEPVRPFLEEDVDHIGTGAPF